MTRLRNSLRRRGSFPPRNCRPSRGAVRKSPDAARRSRFRRWPRDGREGPRANLQWALGGEDVGRINNLRLGESILLGREPLHRKPIDGLHTNAITLTAEVIESKIKPSQPWGTIAQSAFGEKPTDTGQGDFSQLILAIGRQDTDPRGLAPPPGIRVLGASSDHFVLAARPDSHTLGAEITFQLDYSSLVRAMTSPFVARIFKKTAALPS